MGKFCHPNLVKLLGYCWEENQFLLVYEYMQKGSLENHLFRSKKRIISETKILCLLSILVGTQENLRPYINLFLQWEEQNL